MQQGTNRRRYIPPAKKKKTKLKNEAKEQHNRQAAYSPKCIYTIVILMVFDKNAKSTAVHRELCAHIGELVPMGGN